MLAQNFRTAEALWLKKDEYNALIAFLGMLERGEIKHVDSCIAGNLHGDIRPRKLGSFNMGTWKAASSRCGSVHCIGGAIDIMIGRRPCYTRNAWTPFPNEPFERLCYPPEKYDYNLILEDQAAQAIRSYLSTGEANWEDILGDTCLVGQ